MFRPLAALLECKKVCKQHTDRNSQLFLGNLVQHSKVPSATNETVRSTKIQAQIKILATAGAMQVRSFKTLPKTSLHTLGLKVNHASIQPPSAEAFSFGCSHLNCPVHILFDANSIQERENLTASLFSFIVPYYTMFFKSQWINLPKNDFCLMFHPSHKHCRVPICPTFFCDHLLTSVLGCSPVKGKNKTMFIEYWHTWTVFQEWQEPHQSANEGASKPE